MISQLQENRFNNFGQLQLLTIEIKAGWNSVVFFPQWLFHEIFSDL
jgi:hypothetical protein